MRHRLLVAALMLVGAAPLAGQTEIRCGNVRIPIPPAQAAKSVVDTLFKRVTGDSIPCLRTNGSAETNLRNRLALRADAEAREKIDTVKIVTPPVHDTVPLYCTAEGDVWVCTPTKPDGGPPIELPPDSIPQVPGSCPDCSRLVRDTVIQGDLRVPMFAKWEIGRNVVVNRGSVLVQSAVLVMRPGASLRFTGGDPNAYVGGGMQWTPEIGRTDFGLWCWDACQLDLQGTPKTPWGRTLASNWTATDELWITPTLAGDFAPHRWHMGEPIPRVDPTVPGAELANATRDVTIGGVGHIHVHSSMRQTILNIRLDSLGISNFASRGAVLGRYALHLHMMGNAAAGSLIEGVVSMGARGKVFVVHASHGVTLKNVVCLNSYESCNWWDFIDQTNDFSIDGMLACGVYMPDAIRGTQDNGIAISLPSGENMEIANSVACGAQGGLLATGFDWPEPTSAFPENPKLVWRFRTGNVAHNNRGQGLRFWTNNQDRHINEQFVCYRNSHGCIENGAYFTATEYLNFTSWDDGYQFGNGEQETAGILNNASATTSGDGHVANYTECRVTKLHAGPGMQVGHRQLPATHALRVQRCTFDVLAGEPQVLVGDGTNPWLAEFFETNVLPERIVFVPSAGNEGSVVLVDPDGPLGPQKCRKVSFIQQQRRITDC